MKQLDHFKQLIQKIEYSEIKTETGATLGWNAYIYNMNSVVEAGGSSSTRESALRIAYAELIERDAFLEVLRNASLKNEFLLDQIPTSCGFAAGFSKNETRCRAICEAIERWCWSKWIDESKKIDEFLPTNLDPLTKFFLQHFDDYRFFVKKINTKNIPELKYSDIYFCAILAFKNNGVFLGSRVSNDYNDLFLHSSIEAYRAKIIFENLADSKRKSDFYIERVKYWGDNKNNMPDVDSFSDNDLDAPLLSLSKEVVTCDSYFVHRALCDNYIPWHLGDEKRFIY